MSWEKAKAMSQEGGSKDYIKLKDGQFVEGVFVGEPYPFYQKYQDKLEYTEWAEGRSFRFKMNFVTKENGQYVCKIFQNNKTTFKALEEAIAEYGQDCLYKVKRTGSTKEDTTYSVLFKAKLNEEQVAKVKAVDMHPLHGKTGNGKVPGAEPSVPFDIPPSSEAPAEDEIDF